MHYFLLFCGKNNNLVIVSLKRKQALLASNLPEIGLTDWNGRRLHLKMGPLLSRIIPRAYV
jgi:hypothetical protein